MISTFRLHRWHRDHPLPFKRLFSGGEYARCCRDLTRSDHPVLKKTRYEKSGEQQPSVLRRYFGRAVLEVLRTRCRRRRCVHSPHPQSSAHAALNPGGRRAKRRPSGPPPQTTRLAPFPKRVLASLCPSSTTANKQARSPSPSSQIRRTRLPRTPPEPDPTPGPSDHTFSPLSPCADRPRSSTTPRRSSHRRSARRCRFSLVLPVRADLRQHPMRCSAGTLTWRRMKFWRRNVVRRARWMIRQSQSAGFEC